ncbi:hypothetical protein COBT_002752, partial [Conglomerata obtusa]
NLSCDENETFSLQYNYGPVSESIELLKYYINENKDFRFKKIFPFVYTSRNQSKMFGHCVYQIDRGFLYCYVLLMKKFRVGFYFWNLQLKQNKECELLLKNLMFCNTDLFNRITILSLSDQKPSFNYNLRYVFNYNISIVDEQHCNSSNKNIAYVFNIQPNSYLMSHEKFEADFVISTITCLLLEKKIVFLAKDNAFLFETINLFLNLLKPFSWQYFIFCPLPQKLFSLLDSPFPFVVGITCDYKIIKKYLKKNDIVIIDLDNKKITNKPKKIKLPFQNNLKTKLSSYNFINSLREYLAVIKNIIDIAREKTIMKNCENIKNIISDPKIIIDAIDEEHANFFKLFFETRIFKYYIDFNFIEKYKINLVICQSNCQIIVNQTMIDLKTKINNVYDLFFRLIFCAKKDNLEFDIEDLLSFYKLGNEDKEHALKHYIMFYGKLNQIEKMYDLYKYAINEKIVCRNDVYKSFNHFENDISLEFFDFLDLSDYKIHFNNALLSLLNGINSIAIENLEQHEEYLSLKITKNNLNPTNYKILGIEQLLYLIDYLNFENMKKTYLLENHPEIFWNICFYLKYYNLPINFMKKICEEDAIAIIDENTLNISQDPVLELYFNKSMW